MFFRLSIREAFFELPCESNIPSLCLLRIIFWNCMLKAWVEQIHFLLFIEYLLQLSTKPRFKHDQNEKL